MNLGQVGESLAARFLKERGHQLLEQNFRFAHGEIDIISFYQGTLVFTEVKTRRNANYGRPLEAVDTYKKRQIYHTAEFYLTTRPIHYHTIRFDVIEVFIGEQSMIHHIPAAFNGNDLEE